MEKLRELKDKLSDQIEIFGEMIESEKSKKMRTEYESLRTVVSVWYRMLVSALDELNRSRPV